MHVRSTLAVAATLALAAPSLGCATMSPLPPATPPPTAAAQPPKPPGHVYKLDFALAPGGAYTMVLEENRNGEIRVGTNLPLSPTAPVSPRQDVGLNLHCSFATSGDDLLLHTNLEMSSVDEPAGAAWSIRKLSTAGDALVSPGKLAMINSIEDPAAHRRYQLTVTATRLR